jgi:hypothetical protein
MQSIPNQLFAWKSFDCSRDSEFNIRCRDLTPIGDNYLQCTTARRTVDVHIQVQGGGHYPLHLPLHKPSLGQGSVGRVFGFGPLKAGENRIYDSGNGYYYGENSYQRIGMMWVLNEGPNARQEACRWFWFVIGVFSLICAGSGVLPGFAGFCGGGWIFFWAVALMLAGWALGFIGLFTFLHGESASSVL